MAYLTVQNLSVFYDGNPALDRLSLEIPANRITAVIGPSGCGKTTLLHSLNGMIRETPGARVEGSIALSGREIRQIPQEELRRRIGLVFQTPSPFPFSIYKNMTYAPRYYGIRSKKQLDAIVEEKLTQAGLYDEVRDDLGKNARKLSGGQQQRLCIARALTVEPEILLLDEPCSALDIHSTMTIETLLTKLKQNYTIVMVTHNIQQARRIADHLVFLHSGKLVEAGPAEKLFTEPEQPQTRDFLSGAFG